MEMRIYIANLAAYNNGHLVGKWVDLPTSKEELQEEIQSVLDAWNDGFSPSEEIAIHDYELPFEIGEYENPFAVNEWAQIIINSGEDENVVRAIIENFPSVSEGIAKLENVEYHVYCDCDSMADVAYYHYQENGLLDSIEQVISSHYIDWEAIGRDMEIEGTFIYAGNNTYVEIM